MRALLQRVSHAAVHVDDKTIGAIGPGLVVLVGVAADDSIDDVNLLAKKILNLRIFKDNDGKFNVSALDVQAELLVISQFTLYADTRRGRRPGFTDAARPEQAEASVTDGVLTVRVPKSKEKAAKKIEIA